MMEEKRKIGIGTFITLGVIGAIIAFIVLKFCITIIPAGYVGIQYSLNGGIQDEILNQGLRFKTPIIKVTKYPISRQQVYLSANESEGKKDDESFYIPTSDGKSVNVDLEFSYKFDPNNLGKTYSEFRGKSPSYIEDTFIRAKMKSWSGEVSSRFSLTDIYGEKRSELNKAVLDYVVPKFNEYGIIIEGVSFTQIRLDEQTTQAIQNKINKQQEVETARLESEKAQIENERKIAQAEADAKQIKIKAEAEAEANRVLAQSVTDGLIRLKEAEARLQHGWISVLGGNVTNAVVENKQEATTTN